MSEAGSWIYVKCGEDATAGDVLMFDEMFGAIRSEGDNAATGNNGARKIRNTSDGQRIRQCGVVVDVSIKKDEYGWLLIEGFAPVKIAYDAEAYDGKALSKSADETAGQLSPGTENIAVQGIGFQNIASVSGANKRLVVPAYIRFPWAQLVATGAPQTQTARNVQRVDPQI